MTKFTSFDKAACQSLRSEMNALLTKYGVDANLEFTVGNMRFLQESVEIKVSAKVKGGKAKTDVALERMAKIMNLSLEVRSGKKLVAYNSRSYKYPFVYLNSIDGKRYKCSEAQAQVYFKV